MPPTAKAAAKAEDAERKKVMRDAAQLLRSTAATLSLKEASASIQSNPLGLYQDAPASPALSGGGPGFSAGAAAAPLSVRDLTNRFVAGAAAARKEKVGLVMQRVAVEKARKPTVAKTRLVSKQPSLMTVVARKGGDGSASSALSDSSADADCSDDDMVLHVSTGETPAKPCAAKEHSNLGSSQDTAASDERDLKRQRSASTAEGCADDGDAHAEELTEKVRQKHRMMRLRREASLSPTSSADGFPAPPPTAVAMAVANASSQQGHSNSTPLFSNKGGMSLTRSNRCSTMGLAPAGRSNLLPVRVAVAPVHADQASIKAIERLVRTNSYENSVARTPLTFTTAAAQAAAATSPSAGKKKATKQ
jgi:hypothetical protein